MSSNHKSSLHTYQTSTVLFWSLNSNQVSRSFDEDHHFTTHSFTILFVEQPQLHWTRYGYSNLQLPIDLVWETTGVNHFMEWDPLLEDFPHFLSIVIQLCLLMFGHSPQPHSSPLRLLYQLYRNFTIAQTENQICLHHQGSNPITKMC